MFIAKKVEQEVKKLIVEGYCKEDILGEITRKHGPLAGLPFFYDCCYNSICKQLGINRKRGEELKPTKVRLKFKKGKQNNG